MKTTDQIKEALENLTTNELKDYWNDYQAETSGEGMIYDFDSDEFFDEHFSSPAEAARAVFFGDIESWNAKYVTYNGYGNIITSNDLESMISIYDLVNHIDRNQNNYETLLED